MTKDPQLDVTADHSKPGSGLRILFAEDDAGMRWLVERYLEGLGHSIHVVQDGLQAVEAARSQTFDVVLLDLLMPTMDGIDAARAIRDFADSAGQHFPIIAATSHHVEHLGDRWDASAFDAVLSKPIQGNELADILARFAC